MYRLLTKCISSINLDQWYIYINQHYIIQIEERVCSVATVTRLGVGRPRKRGSIPDRGRQFFSSVNRPDQVRGQPPIGCNGKRDSFLLIKAAGEWDWSFIPI